MATPLHINIAVREDVPRERTWVREPADEYTEATGNRETIPYTGPWEAMLTMGEQSCSGSKSASRITAELTRMPGGMAELRVTTETYRKPDTDDEDGDGDGEGDGSGDDSAELGTEDAPSYSMSSSLVQVCILAHPKFAALSNLERRALKAMIDGQDENSMLDDDTSPAGSMRIKDCITGTLAQKAYDYVSRGIYYWNDISTEATARWKGSHNRYTPGQIVDTAPGGFPAGLGRNWLCSGAGKEKNGKQVHCSASFRLSGLGGWDAWLYGGSQS